MSFSRSVELALKKLHDRNDKRLDLGIEGELDVMFFMRAFGMDWPDFVAMGLLRDRAGSDPLLELPYERTATGIKFLRYHKVEDIITVRPGKADELLAFCRKARKRTPGRSAARKKPARRVR